MRHMLSVYSYTNILYSINMYLEELIVNCLLTRFTFKLCNIYYILYFLYYKYLIIHNKYNML